MNMPRCKKCGSSGHRQNRCGFVAHVNNINKNGKLAYASTAELLKQKAERNYMGMQTGDVPATWANAELLESLTGYRPWTDFRDEIVRFVEWYREYSGK